MSADCIFCRIISHDIPADVVMETADLIVIKDIRPKAPIHYLIIPKKHIQDIQAFKDQDCELAGKLFLAAKDLCLMLPGTPDFRLVVNSGKQAGQCVFHLHIHFVSGKQFAEF